MSTEKQFDKDVCGINFAAMFAYLDEQGKETSLISQRTGCSREFLTSRREWFDLPMGTIIFNSVKEILGEKDPMVFYEIGKEATRLTNFGVLIDIGQSLGGVQDSVRFLPRFNLKFADLFDMSVYDVKSNSAVVVIYFKKKKYDGFWIFDQCSWSSGNIAGIPGVWKLPHMKIEEELCRFSLQEIFRDYAFLEHDFRYENGKAFLNGKEFATGVIIETEDLVESTDAIGKMNLFRNKRQTFPVLSNKSYRKLDQNSSDVADDTPTGMLITRDTRISDMLTLKEGQIFGAPCCRLNIRWEEKRKFSNSIVKGAFGRSKNFVKVIERLEDELEANIEQKRELLKAQKELRDAHEELKRYANNLEDMVEERTIELRDAQTKLIESEKRALEHRITGGFAHEMRNALAGAQLEFKTILNYKDKGKPTAQILKDSATSLLKNISLIHEKYSIPREEIATLVLPELKTIAEIADHLSDVHSGVSSDLNRGLSITTQIRDYARMSEFRPGDAEVDIVPMLKDYGQRYSQDFERIGIIYSVDGLVNAVALADEIHINSIFSNLILNAKDALEEIESERPKEINVTIDRKDDETGDFFVIKVSDNGPGIPEENRNEIFEPFFSTKPSFGTGLGLGIVKRLVQLYGGEIEVASKVKEGTVFTITLSGAG